MVMCVQPACSFDFVNATALVPYTERDVVGCDPFNECTIPDYSAFLYLNPNGAALVSIRAFNLTTNMPINENCGASSVDVFAGALGPLYLEQTLAQASSTLCTVNAHVNTSSAWPYLTLRRLVQTNLTVGLWIATDAACAPTPAPTPGSGGGGGGLTPGDIVAIAVCAALFALVLVCYVASTVISWAYARRRHREEEEEKKRKAKAEQEP